MQAIQVEDYRQTSNSMWDSGYGAQVNQTTFSSLPVELQMMIFSHVPAQDLKNNVPLVCKEWKALRNRKEVWMPILEKCSPFQLGLPEIMQSMKIHGIPEIMKWVKIIPLQLRIETFNPTQVIPTIGQIEYWNCPKLPPPNYELDPVPYIPIQLIPADLPVSGLLNNYSYTNSGHAFMPKVSTPGYILVDTIKNSIETGKPFLVEHESCIFQIHLSSSAKEDYAKVMEKNVLEACRGQFASPFNENGEEKLN